MRQTGNTRSKAMYGKPDPTIREIRSTQQQIRSSWSEHRRGERQRKAAVRQDQLFQQLLGAAFSCGRFSRV
jgi:hypothetical protein